MSALDTWRAHGVLSSLDVAFARGLVGIERESAEVALAAAFASRAVRQGHVCLDLARLHDDPIVADDGTVVVAVGSDAPSLVSCEQWCTQLRASTVCGDGKALTPLVLAGTRLYLYRYVDYERRLAHNISARLTKTDEFIADESLLKRGLTRLFPRQRGAERPDRQKIAALMACTRRFVVVSGGPGTGKTSTVVRILALMLEQAFAATGEPLTIELLAPTGKAAQRMSEAIELGKARLDTGAQVLAAIPCRASTIHRTLGFMPHQPTRFRRNGDRPLSADVVVVDEASMVDIALMTKLLEAVRPDASLILLGDKDQLVSVEAGAILGDIFGDGASRAYSAELSRFVRRLTGDALPGPAAAKVAPGSIPAIRDATIHLTHSYRFSAASGIGALARSINDGDGERVLSVLRSDEKMPYGEVALWPLSASSADSRTVLSAQLAQHVQRGFNELRGARSAEERLRALGSFRILCAHRRGPLGVEAINTEVERILGVRGRIGGDGLHYDGRPILVTRNDYQLDLFNGDTGVIMVGPRGPMAFFPDRTGGLRQVAPARLPPHETVYAITVHKSQGSELGRIALLLPERLSPLLTRELLYTAVTRARERVDLFGSPDVLKAAIARRVERASGLALRLWNVQ